MHECHESENPLIADVGQLQTYFELDSAAFCKKLVWEEIWPM